MSGERSGDLAYDGVIFDVDGVVARADLARETSQQTTGELVRDVSQPRHGTFRGGRTLLLIEPAGTAPAHHRASGGYGIFLLSSA